MRIYLFWLLGIIMLFMPISLTSCSDDNIGSSNDDRHMGKVCLSGWYKEKQGNCRTMGGTNQTMTSRLSSTKTGTFESYER